jgi:tetratricopeptide (TPR) repeat protein
MVHSLLQSISLAVLTCCTVLASLACNDLSGLTGKQSLPSGTLDPKSFNNPAGAYALYQGVLFAFQASSGDTVTSVGNSLSGGSNGTFVDFLFSSGLLTDELQADNFGGNQLDYTDNSEKNLLDARQLPEGQIAEDLFYNQVQNLRNSAGLAISALAKYDSAASPALRGQMYALQGYSIIFLADYYCSGVPLTTVDYNRDFTYHAGSSTIELYNAAIAKFDTAIALSSDSVRIMNLALIGKGRAYLDLGQYDSAAAAVANIPTGYAYQFLVNWLPNATGTGPGGIFTGHRVMVADLEGGRGLPYRSSGDPRTASQIADSNSFHLPRYVPVKYGSPSLGIKAATVADWVEARLIQVEAAYHGVATGTGSWLDQLNVLRQSAITPALTPDLIDPGSDSARVALIFKERAYWLFLTGHRQGDMRRLIRQYNLWYSDPDAVYPTGPYPLFGQLSLYGEDVTVPVPNDERINPLFHGCISRGA